MSTSSSSGPEDRGNHDALSAWEQRVLSDIEHGLTESDPRLARKMTGAGSKGARRWWWPLSARSTALLFLVFFVLVLAGALLPASWWAALGLVTTSAVVPWLLLAASERNGAS
jgi:DUF3040 family protein